MEYPKNRLLASNTIAMVEPMKRHDNQYPLGTPLSSSMATELELEGSSRCSTISESWLCFSGSMVTELGSLRGSEDVIK